MTEAVVFSDAHVSDADPAGALKVTRFLGETCARSRRLYILGDLFDFWCGPRQAEYEPYRQVLEAIRALSGAGVDVFFFHGNRDFYMDHKTAAKYRFHVVEDSAFAELCGRKALLCHGDMLCTNDVKYHRMRAILRHGLTRAILTRLPARLAFRLARAFRRRSIKVTARKPQWVLGINEAAVTACYQGGVDTVICGHTHVEGVREFPGPGSARRLLTLGDFGTSGSYLECGDQGLLFRRVGT